MMVSVKSSWITLLSACAVLYSHCVVGSDEPVKKTLLWAKNVSPPFYQGSNSVGSRSLGDHIQQYLELELPQYQHEILDIRLPQINELWADKIPVCFSTMIHSDTASKDHVQSIPNIIYEPHGLITRKDLKIDGLKSAQVVSLKSVLVNKSLKLGTIEGRTFGATIDDLLTRYANPDRHKTLERGDTVRQMKLLEQGEFDYAIDYEYVFEYFKKHSFYARKLKFTPIKEVQGSVILGAIGCTNNDWGRAVIADINTAIKRLLKNPEYQESVSIWLSTDAGRKQYLEKFQYYLLSE